MLIGLLNAILRLPQPIVHVQILNPFSYKDFADDKLIVLDIRARDSAGRWLNIEMQVSIFAGLLQRLVYYASTMYFDQLKSGGSYADLRSAISICLLDKKLFRDDASAHHRFRLVDARSRRLPEISPRSLDIRDREDSRSRLDHGRRSWASRAAIWRWTLQDWVITRACVTPRMPRTAPGPPTTSQLSGATVVVSI